MNLENRPGPQPEQIKTLFGSISKSYDLANDVITLGMARYWRKELVRWSGATGGDRVLDCATGTGDLAFEFKKVVGPEGEVIGTDFCEEMLAQAPAKSKRLNLNVRFEVADAMALPYDEAEFDITSIAYGIRNVQDPVKALGEMARVTREGGTVMVLETGETQNPVLRSAIQFYFRHLVPRLGGWVSGRRDAYEYLNRSSSQFPCREKFVEMMKTAYPFQSVEYRSLMGGASFIYRAVK